MKEQSVFKCGFVVLLGRPNVGKSSLINALLREKVAAVSDKPQTTRNAVRCIHSSETAQIVFVDTPGVHTPRHALGNYMMNEVEEALQEANAVCFVVEAGRNRLDPQEEQMISILETSNLPIVLVINKIDSLRNKEAIWKTIELFQEKLRPVAVVPVSAKDAKNLDILLEELTKILPEGDPIYPDEVLMDSTERFLAAEIIREKIFALTEQEVPHSVAVVVEDFKNPEEYPELKTAQIRATIVVERAGQKGILIGAKGERLKEIGSAARLEMEERFGYPIFLELWVKVKPGWRKSPDELRRLGYAF